VAATGAVAILDTAAIITSVIRVVVAAMTQLLFFLFRCFIVLPTTNALDKRILLREKRNE
jgi:hypothetical protein